MGEIFWPKTLWKLPLYPIVLLLQQQPSKHLLLKIWLNFAYCGLCYRFVYFTEKKEFVYLLSAVCLLYFVCLHFVLQRTKPPQACHEVLKMRDFTENQIQLDHMLRNLKNNGLYQNWKLRSPHDNILTPNERDQMNAFQFHYQHTSRSLSVIG